MNTIQVPVSNACADTGRGIHTNANVKRSATNPGDNINTDTNKSKKNKNNHHRAIHKPTKPRKVAKLVANKKAYIGNFKYKRKPLARKLEKGYINLNVTSLNFRNITNISAYADGEKVPWHSLLCEEQRARTHIQNPRGGRRA